MRLLQHLASEGICLLCWWEIAVTYQGSLFNLESFASHTQSSVPIWHLLPLLATMGPLVSELGRKHGWRSQGIIEHDLCMLCSSAGQALFSAEPLCKPDTCPYTAHEHKGVGQLSSKLSHSTCCSMKKMTNICSFLKGHPPVYFVSIMIFNPYLYGLKIILCGLWIFLWGKNPHFFQRTCRALKH